MNCFIISGVYAISMYNDGPDNVAGIAGASIDLKCKLPHGTCQDMYWTRAEEINPTTRSSTLLYIKSQMKESYGDRYSVNVSTDGACILHIEGLQPSDAGTFTCSETVLGAGKQWKKTATVTVAGTLCEILILNRLAQ